MEQRLTTTCGARGFGEARVRHARWRLSIREHLHLCVIVQVLDINLKCYGVNKHNLLTARFFFDESGCEYSWINTLHESLDLQYIYYCSNAVQICM